MRTITITAADAGQRLDKFLRRTLVSAPTSFSYKMLRKKNIVLNGRKAAGSELLAVGDQVAFFLSDETWEKFTGGEADAAGPSGRRYEAEPFLRACERITPLLGKDPVLYEDEHVLLVRKPAGVLSQKAERDDVSMNEWVVGYLMQREREHPLTQRDLLSFRPGICNRLDRGTGGILICAKTPAGSREMTALLRTRELHKYYRLVVLGQMRQGGTVEGYLSKDTRTNVVTVSAEPREGASYTKTICEPLRGSRALTLVEAELITGKTHQIRAHLASVGYPLVGDAKYGNREANAYYRKACGVSDQLLFCTRLEFPHLEGVCSGLSEKVITCPLPEVFERVMEDDHGPWRQDGQGVGSSGRHRAEKAAVKRRGKRQSEHMEFQRSSGKRSRGAHQQNK